MSSCQDEILEYVQTGGQFCPDCSRPTITRGEPVLVAHTIIHVHKRCETCLKEWDDVLILAGISDEGGKIVT